MNCVIRSLGFVPISPVSREKHQPFRLQQSTFTVPLDVFQTVDHQFLDVLDPDDDSLARFILLPVSKRLARHQLREARGEIPRARADVQHFRAPSRRVGLLEEFQARRVHVRRGYRRVVPDRQRVIVVRFFFFRASRVVPAIDRAHRVRDARRLDYRILFQRANERVVVHAVRTPRHSERRQRRRADQGAAGDRARGVGAYAGARRRRARAIVRKRYFHFN